MDRRSLCSATLAVVAMGPLTGGPARGEARLAAVTFNVWHGLRAGGVWRLDGEPGARGEQRFAWQIVQLRDLAPDVVFLQEVNPAPQGARRYAERLDYEEIHEVVNCGVHLGPLHVPRNVNEGLVILARPGLALRRVRAERLSGAALCSDAVGVQCSESRAALFGRIEVEGRQILLVNTHLHRVPAVGEDFEQRLAALVEQGRVERKMARRVSRRLAAHRTRLQQEMERLIEAIESVREPSDSAVLVGGDLNCRPGAAPCTALIAHGYTSASEALSPGEEWVTYDPGLNGVNAAAAGSSDLGLPGKDVPALADLYAARPRPPHQIDHLFARGALEPVGVRVVLDRDLEGLYASDHFGLGATFRLAD